MNNRTKHMGIDVLSVMKGIVDSHVKHYQNDFDIDTESLRGAALKKEQKGFLYGCAGNVGHGF